MHKKGSICIILAAKFPANKSAKNLGVIFCAHPKSYNLWPEKRASHGGGGLRRAPSFTTKTITFRDSTTRSTRPVDSLWPPKARFGEFFLATARDYAH